MEFIKKDGLKLINGGYLVTNNKEETPLFHFDFVKAQDAAHYVVELSKAIKGKDFEGKKADSFEDVVSQVTKSINETQSVEYVKLGKAPKTAIQDSLAKEALAWLKHEDEKSSVERVNSAMQQFNILQEFEEFGLYFEQDIVKLPALYDVATILKAVKEVDAVMHKQGK